MLHKTVDLDMQLFVLLSGPIGVTYQNDMQMRFNIHNILEWYTRSTLLIYHNKSEKIKLLTQKIIWSKQILQK